MKSIAGSGEASIYLTGFLLKWFETRRCFFTIAFQLCFRVCH